MHPFVKTGLKYRAPYWTKAGKDFKFGSHFKLVDQKLLNGKKILQAGAQIQFVFGGLCVRGTEFS